jgi:UDP-N-acetyl-D-mannosaminuronic acid transferase (WecB/TagA/CpsF family)
MHTNNEPIRAQHPQGTHVLDCFINACSWRSAINSIHRWGNARESRYVCICNVHSLITARKDPAFRKVLNEADMATPDGMPVAWMMRQMGFPLQERINGPDLMWKYCALAEQRNEPVFLYGNTPQTLSSLMARLHMAFPHLQIAGSYSPPFRPLTEREDANIVAKINRSGARVVSALPSITTPAPCSVRRHGCSSAGWNGCTACAANRAGCGSATWSPTRSSSSAPWAS